MKKLILILVTLFAFTACTVDNRTEIESPIQERIIDLDIREVDNEDNYLKIETSPNDFIYIHKDSIAKNVAERNNGKGKGNNKNVSFVEVTCDNTQSLPLEDEELFAEWFNDGYNTTNSGGLYDLGTIGVDVVNGDLRFTRLPQFTPEFPIIDSSTNWNEVVYEVEIRSADGLTVLDSGCINNGNPNTVSYLTTEVVLESGMQINIVNIPNCSPRTLL